MASEGTSASDTVPTTPKDESLHEGGPVPQEQKGKGREASAGSESQDNNEEHSEDSQSASPSAESGSTPAQAQTPSSSAWQAIWSPQYNAYYFFNSLTQETTWANPLQPEASSSAVETPAQAAPVEEEQKDEPSSSTGPQMSRVAQEHAALQAAALAQGIDPALAHLDPSLLHSSIPGATGPSDLPTFKAQFNARTGQFAPANSRTPGHLSEFERAKRMSEFYFDVNKWEEDLAKRGGRLMGEEDGVDESGKKRKRPTKKDIERFKEQKRLKKIAKTAWLRT